MHRALTISELNYLVFFYLDRLALARAHQTCKLVKSAVDEFFNLEQVAPHKLVGLLPAGLVNPHPRWIDPNPRPFIDPLPDELRHLTWHGVTNPPSKTLAGRVCVFSNVPLMGYLITSPRPYYAPPSSENSI